MQQWGQAAHSKEAAFGMCSLPDGWPTSKRVPPRNTTNPARPRAGSAGVLWTLLSLNPGGISDLDFRIDGSFSYAKTRRRKNPLGIEHFSLNKTINLAKEKRC